MANIGPSQADHWLRLDGSDHLTGVGPRQVELESHQDAKEGDDDDEEEEEDHEHHDEPTS